MVKNHFKNETKDKAAEQITIIFNKLWAEYISLMENKKQT